MKHPQKYVCIKRYGLFRWIWEYYKVLAIEEGERGWRLEALVRGAALADGSEVITVEGETIG